MQDMRGVQIHDGDEVVFASRKGSFAMMQRATVEFGGVYDGSLRVRKLDGKKGIVRLTKLDRVAVVSLQPSAPTATV